MHYYFRVIKVLKNERARKKKPDQAALLEEQYVY